MTSYSNQRWSTKYYTEWTSRCVYHTMVGLSATTPSPQPGYLVRKVCGYGYPAGWKTKPVKGRRSSVWANSHPYLMSNCVCSRPPAAGWLFSKVGARICTPATVKPFTPQNPQTQRKLKTHSMGVPPLLLSFTGKLTGGGDWGKVCGTPIHWW